MASSRIDKIKFNSWEKFEFSSIKFIKITIMKCEDYKISKIRRIPLVRFDD